MRQKPPVPIQRMLSQAFALVSLFMLFGLIGPGCVAGDGDGDGDEPPFEDPPDEVIAAAEQQIVSTGPVNLALGKATSQSTDLGGWPSWKAVDGVQSGGIWDITHTATGDQAPWWRLNLGQEQLVGSIVVYNRTDCCSERLNGATVELSNDAGQIVQSWRLTGAAEQRLYAMDGKVGRYVKISKSGEYLSLGEVEVFPPITINVARGKSASQSTTYGSNAFPAANAVDDNTASGFTHTADGDVNPWWEVDLGGDYSVSSVDVLNRVGCCPERLNGATVHLMNASRQDVKTWTLNSNMVQTFWGGGKVAHYVRITQAPGGWWNGQPGDPDNDGDGVPDPVFVGSAYLSLTEVVVNSPFTKNIAPGKTATQSSSYQGNTSSYGPAKAMDGNSASNNFTHTADGDNNPWWQLDLGASSFVASVDVYNRWNYCCPERLNGAKFKLLDAGGRTVRNSEKTLTADMMQHIDLGAGLRARYVRIEHTTPYLALAEVAVNSANVPINDPPLSMYCYLDTYGRGVGAPVSDCPGGHWDAGLCYPNCPSGYTGVGPVCWQDCAAGYSDVGAFCYREGDIYGNGCTGQCASGYTNDGCTCRKDPHSYTKATVTLPVGSFPTCANGLELQNGLCYKACEGGMIGEGPVCWGKCPIGMVPCGAGCAQDAGVCHVVLQEMIMAPIAAVANIQSLLTSGARAAAIQTALTLPKHTLLSPGQKLVTEEILLAYARNNGGGYVSDDALEEIIGDALQTIDPALSGNPDAIIALNFFKNADPTGLISLGLAFAKPICPSTL